MQRLPSSCVSEKMSSALRVHITSTIMRNNSDRVTLAQSAIEAARQFASTPSVVQRSMIFGAGMILVPVKNLSSAKQRLSPILNPEERFALAQAMCEDVLQALADWQGGPRLQW